MKYSLDKELDGWIKWGTVKLPTNGWVLIKKPGEFPKAYLVTNLPVHWDTSNFYWKHGPTVAEYDYQ